LIWPRFISPGVGYFGIVDDSMIGGSSAAAISSAIFCSNVLHSSVIISSVGSFASENTIVRV
jgi:hypothetical protein